MQFLNGTLSFFGRLHLNKSKPLGTLGLTMADYFDRNHLTNAFEQFCEIVFGSVEG